MKTIYSIIILSVFIFNKSYNQNLVPNPSFENRVNCDIYGDCPTSPTMCIAEFWTSAKGSPDYFNSCSENTNIPYFGYNIGSFSTPHNLFGYQSSDSGNAYAGFFTHLGFNPNNQNEREWLSCQLISPMVVGKKYYISFYVSLADSVNCATNNIGVLFTTYSKYFQVYSPQFNYAHFKTEEIIQDTSSWTLVSGSFIADSAYSYMMIGNFFDYSLTDSIHYPNRPLMLNRDTSECYAYYYIDDVYVSKDSLTSNIALNQEQYLEIFPNPADEIINISLPKITELPANLKIYNITGKCVKTVLINSYNNYINIEELTEGIYYLQIQTKNKTYNQKLIINH